MCSCQRRRHGLHFWFWPCFPLIEMQSCLIATQLWIQTLEECRSKYEKGAKCHLKKRKITKFTVELMIKCAPPELYLSLFRFQRTKGYLPLLSWPLQIPCPPFPEFAYILLVPLQQYFIFFFFTQKSNKEDGVMLIKNSRWLPCDSHETKIILLSHGLTFLIYIPGWLEPKGHLGRVKRGILKYYAPGWQHVS